jgi:transcriptional regulator with XRE-family HTH domain
MESPLAAAPHQGFAQRLHVTLDLAGVEKGRGRTKRLADHFAVTRETARKWLNGQSLPELERMLDIAKRLGVSFEWLATGRGVATPHGKVLEPSAPYRVDNREQSRLIGLVNRLPREQRRALLTILEHLAEKR